MEAYGLSLATSNTINDDRTLLATMFAVLVGLLAALLLPWKLRMIKKNVKPRKISPPEAEGAWPVIGHLRLLGGPDLPHIALGKMADKYGPIFLIRIGRNPTVVVSSSEVAREIFTTNNKVWSSKPKVIGAMRHMVYDTAMYGFSPYGPYWQKINKIVMQKLLSNSRLELVKHVWGSEINTSMKQLYEKVASGGAGETLVDMKNWLSVFTTAMSLRMIAGKRCFGQYENEVSRRYHKALSNFFRLVAVFVPSDAIPILRGWIDLGGYESEMRRTREDLDCILSQMLVEHNIKKTKRSGESNKEAAEEDFMDVMLSILDEDPKLMSDFEFDADTIIKATCLTMMVAGTDTLMVTMVWVLSLLVNHPHILQKVHEEMDMHVGRERQVDESDIKNLLYLRAAIKETMRLYPPGPMLTRESTEDCTIFGYHIPAATRLIMNISKIQRDPEAWSNPSEFKPERFLTGADVDVSGDRNFQFVPFGGGRRSCPATSLSHQVVHLALARMIHGFEFKTPSGAPTDMTESPGLTNVKATPLDVLVTPRLPSKLYTAC